MGDVADEEGLVRERRHAAAVGERRAGGRRPEARARVEEPAGQLRDGLRVARARERLQRDPAFDGVRVRVEDGPDALDARRRPRRVALEDLERRHPDGPVDAVVARMGERRVDDGQQVGLGDPRFAGARRQVVEAAQRLHLPHLREGVRLAPDERQEVGHRRAVLPARDHHRRGGAGQGLRSALRGQGEHPAHELRHLVGHLLLALVDARQDRERDVAAGRARVGQPVLERLAHPVALVLHVLLLEVRRVRERLQRDGPHVEAGVLERGFDGPRTVLLEEEAREGHPDDVGLVRVPHHAFHDREERGVVLLEQLLRVLALVGGVAPEAPLEVEPEPGDGRGADQHRHRRDPDDRAAAGGGRGGGRGVRVRRRHGPGPSRKGSGTVQVTDREENSKARAGRGLPRGMIGFCKGCPRKPPPPRSPRAPARSCSPPRRPGRASTRRSPSASPSIPARSSRGGSRPAA